MCRSNLQHVSVTAAKVIPLPYKGDFDGLEAFLAGIDQITTFSENNEAIVVAFLNTRLTGKARSAVPTTANTPQLIKNALKAKIKPPPSSVVEAELTALGKGNKSVVHFAREVEEITERLRKSYLAEVPDESSAQQRAAKAARDTLCKNTIDNGHRIALFSAPAPDPETIIGRYLEIQTQMPTQNVLYYGNVRSRNNLHRNYRSNYANNANNNRNYRGRNRPGNQNGYNQGCGREATYQNNRRRYENSSNNRSRYISNVSYNQGNVHYARDSAQENSSDPQQILRLGEINQNLN